MSNQTDQTFLKEWDSSFGFFYAPAILFVFSLLYVLMVHTTIGMLLLILLINGIFCGFAYLRYFRQRILIYTNRLEYHYSGAWGKPQVKVFEYNSEDIDKLRTPSKRNRLQKIFNYSDVFIENNRGESFLLEKVGEPDSFHEELSEVVQKYIRQFDPDFKVNNLFVQPDGVFKVSDTGDLVKVSDSIKKFNQAEKEAKE